MSDLVDFFNLTNEFDGSSLNLDGLKPQNTAAQHFNLGADKVLNDDLYKLDLKIMKKPHISQGAFNSIDLHLKVKIAEFCLAMGYEVPSWFQYKL